MKKILIASLLALCATFSFAAIGCGDDKSDSEKPNGGIENPTPQGETYTVTLNAGEGYKIVGDGVTYDNANGCWKAEVVENTTFQFSLDVGAFYTGIPAVTMDNVNVPQNSDGSFSVKITKDSEITVDGIFKDASAMMGSGAFDDAYVISRPIDFLYIAEQVNAGKGNYASAAYVLAADIDFKGEEIIPIGTGTNPFTGVFTCQTNEEETATKGYTISNFKINATDNNYVGLFGCVQVDMSVSSSGLFYGINIANFEINASTIGLDKYNRNIYCGGLIGYGVGSRAYLCTAVNGEINVSADPTEFSFVGGLIGVQQSAYVAEYSQMYNAETAYATVDVNVNVVSGTTLYAGGITGYLITNSFTTPAYIHNSYSTGNVSGAIRSGGIAGGLGQYTSVTTSYSTGNVTANSPITAQTDGYQKEHCIAYAGGIVGYAENDTVVNECFAVGTMVARAVDGKDAEKTHYAVGGGDDNGKVSVSSRKYIVRDCRDSIDKSSMVTTLEGMGFHSYNWILTNSDYPVINYESSEDSLSIKTNIQFIDKEGNDVLVEGEAKTEYLYTNTYVPIARAFVDGMIAWTMRTDDEKLLSFGYFFDKECTQPVPSSFITTKDTTLYVGFANPTAVVGEYTLAVKGAETPLKIIIQPDGTALCANGNTTTEAIYQYNGETLVIEGAYLARYFMGEVDDSLSVNGDTLFDMNRYTSYYFQANLTSAGLELFDGTYFTEAAPLKAFLPTEFNKFGAYYVYHEEDGYADEYVFQPDGTGTKNGRAITYTYANGSLTVGNATLNINDLQAYDALKGTWQKSAFVTKAFNFDGINAWKAYTNVYTRDTMGGSVSTTSENLVRGSYEKQDNETYLLKTDDGATYATVIINDEGFLSVTYTAGGTEAYAAENSFVGEWRTNGVTLRFDGINEQGEGKATVTFTAIDTTYDLTYTRSETATHLCLYLSGSMFGYFSHDLLTNTLQATMYDPTSFTGEYATYHFRLINDFNDAWISNNETFDNIRFSGTGSYNANGNWIGTFTIGDDNQTYEYVLRNGGTSGYFDYNDTRYNIQYNDMTGEITVNDTVVLERKDALADTEFVWIDDAGKISTFTFDGKGGLTAGGTLTMKLAGEDATTYAYKVTDTPDTYEIIDGGAIVKNEDKACYELTINGKTYELYIRNAFMGNWALSGEFADDVFVIGATDLDGYIHATFMGESTKIEKLDTDFYSFYCEPNGMPTTYYVYVLYDNETGKFDSFAISEYPSLVYNDYILCSRIDAMKGTWEMYNNKDITISFDGVQSLYSNGIATISYKGYPTPYVYRIYEDAHGEVESVLLWSQNVYNGSTLYYKLIPTEKPTGTPSAETNEIFVLGDKAFVRSEVDSLYKMTATDEDGWTYEFDGGNLDDDTWGTIIATKAGEENRTLTYDLVSFNDDMTTTLTVKETVGGVEKTYVATLDYSDNTNVIITFEEQAA